MDLFVPDMTCAHCVATIERGIKARDPSAVVAVDLDTHLVRVQSTLPPDEVRQAVVDAGYGADPV